MQGPRVFQYARGQLAPIGIDDKTKDDTREIWIRPFFP